MSRHDHDPVMARWDAGDMGCAQLIVGVASQLAGLPNGGLLEVTARSAGAPVDLPAWCRLAGHELRSAAHPVYLVRRRPQ